MEVNLTNELNAQDMIIRMADDKKITFREAIEKSVTSRNYLSIMRTGWASIALSLWGHDEPEREVYTLENPFIEVNFTAKQISFIAEIAKREKVEIPTAIAYFILFEMSELGYHI